MIGTDLYRLFGHAAENLPDSQAPAVAVTSAERGRGARACMPFAWPPTPSGGRGADRDGPIAALNATVSSPSRIRKRNRCGYPCSVAVTFSTNRSVKRGGVMPGLVRDQGRTGYNFH